MMLKLKCLPLQERILRQKQAEEEAKQKECTFKPITNVPHFDFSGSQQVRNLWKLNSKFCTALVSLS